jgi:glucokinase
MKKAYAGIDLGGSFIKAGLLTSSGKRISSFQIPTEADAGPRKVGDNLLTAVRKLDILALKYKTKLAGIGIGSPGTIRYPEGIVTGSSPNIPGWVGTDISKILRGFHTKITVDNDANCMALGEYLFGAGRGSSSGFYLTIGTGIGGAFIQDRQLLRGASFAAGEFGHTVLKYNGIKCKCGRRGCVEAYTAVPALIRFVKKIAGKYRGSSLGKKQKSLTPTIIFEAFKKGDRAAVDAVSQNAEMLGSAIGSVINLINPEIVVIGGGISQAGGKYINLLKENISSFAFPSAARGLKVKKAGLGNNAGWIGAACLNIKKPGV